MKHRSEEGRRAGRHGGQPPQRGNQPGMEPDHDAHPWREHAGHVPREFEQGGRRAQYRTEGEHANDEARYGDARRWPSRPADGSLGPDRPRSAGGDRPVGDQGYRRGGAMEYGHDAHDARRDAPGERSFQGTGTYAGTSGYDDYETEALYGAGFDRGDWPRTWERGERHSAVRTRGPARGEGHRGRGPEGYRRSDQRILEDVSDRIADDPYIDGRRISVAVKDGTVRVEGEVGARWIKHHLEHIAARCMGVVDVDNRVRVVRDEE